MGLSGVSMWGSDIGGFFALSAPQTTPELLARWLEFGFASGVMRTQANGFQLQPQARAQIFDPGTLPIWARYAKLRTQLYPYLAAAEAEYDSSGMPLMRHLSLAFPADQQATAREDEYLLGADLLVAPVTAPDARERALYLPPGRWIDWWRSVSLDARGAPRLGAPRTLDGARDTTLAAPLEELPLLVREGAVIPLLHPSVETLTEYGAGAAVRLRDRESHLRLLAWPRGRRTIALGPEAGDTATSEETASGWTLQIDGRRPRSYDIEAALGSLAAGAFRPCSVRAGERGRTPVHSWRYDRATGVLRLRLFAERARLVVRSCAQ
jgi:hypothetical protein